MLLTALAALAAGCQALTPEPRLDSPLFAVPEGSTLKLRRTLEIAPNEVGIYVQNGRVLRYSDVNRYYPHCKFELWTMADVAREVSPDEFTVERVERDWYLVRARPSIRVAGVGVGAAEDGGGPVFEVRSTIMYLESARQPDVYRMTCEHWDDAAEARHLTIEQIRAALGEAFSLELPPEVQRALP